MNFFKFFPRLVFPLLALVSCAAVSGEYREKAAVEFSGGTEETILYGLSPDAASGKLPLSPGKKYSYLFDKTLLIAENTSLLIEYTFPENFSSLPPDGEVVLKIGNDSWTLPSGYSAVRYAVPVPPGALSAFDIEITGEEKNSRREKETVAAFGLKTVSIVNRFYGFIFENPLLTPFVYVEKNGNVNIDFPPLQYRIAGKSEIKFRTDSSTAFNVYAGERRFESLPTPEASGLFLPSGILPDDLFPLIYQGETPLSFILAEASNKPFPGPVPADPGVILEYPQKNWRDSRYEIFSWDRFPQVLILDTADYTVQDKLLKRLAFFVEKAGFRGRLAPDREIADLHGWNAHDYRAEDLAAFFEAARASNFPLLPEEKEMEAILLSNRIIRRLENEGGKIAAGEGALISISRESSKNLRTLFMNHEAFHGLFFIDADFREFSLRRWENLSPGAKRFILSYFDYQTYDIKDSYLMVNEFMAHCLQQPASRAAAYFGETLAGRIAASSWRRTVLPPGDGPVWPELAKAFETEAAALSAYVDQRWGLAAGRVWRIIIH
ncbi:hypothetical protein AGMMS49928_08700 [Spirochaetia bacterium]|nr:hypothetical protein AGMMS49928_08700 [Spirochaetia bacterium]